jgi:hypothetical protein
LNDEEIIVGSTDYIVKNNDFLNSIKAAHNAYVNRIFNIARSLMGLATIVNSDCFVIKQEVLEKLKCVDFKDLNSELKYTTLLVRNRFIPKYLPTVRTFTDIENYKSREPSLSFKLKLLKHCFTLMFKSNIKFAELMLNCITPNFWLLVLIYAGILVFTYNYYFFFDYSVVLGLGIVFAAAFIASIFTARIKKEQILYLLCYPLYSLLKMVTRLPVVSAVTNFICRKIHDAETREMTTVDVSVTDGSNDLKCKLDLISESGLVKAVFRFKKKKHSSGSHIRMLDAIQDISDKLNEHGFRIKICQSCGYFNLKLDGSTNMIKGFCNRVVVQEYSEEPVDTILWNNCEYFLPQEVNKIIDINAFREDR